MGSPIRMRAQSLVRLRTIPFGESIQGIDTLELDFIMSGKQGSPFQGLGGRFVIPKKQSLQPRSPAEPKTLTIISKIIKNPAMLDSLLCRGNRARTCGLAVPNRAL